MNERRAHAVAPAGHWPEEEARATLTLPHAERHRRRLAMTDDSGAPFLLDLPRATLLADGDGLELEGGGWIRVRAAAEAVAEVRAGTPATLARLAWHIGNRHMPLQILPDGGLRLPWDHVLVAMLEGLGATVERRLASFHPEYGAYAGAAEGHGHGHEHGHGHG